MKHHLWSFRWLFAWPGCSECMESFTYTTLGYIHLIIDKKLATSKLKGNVGSSQVIQVVPFKTPQTLEATIRHWKKSLNHPRKVTSRIAGYIYIDIHNSLHGVWVGNCMIQVCKISREKLEIRSRRVFPRWSIGLDEYSEAKYLKSTLCWTGSQFGVGFLSKHKCLDLRLPLFADFLKHQTSR